MKQRVVVALATVWLTSIVGASVLSGVTAFSTPNPPGPTPDQYTPLLRSSRHNPQDDYGQDWMEDELSRIKIEGRREKLSQSQTGSADLDETAFLEFKSHESVPRRSGIDADPGKPYHFKSSDLTEQSKIDRKAMEMPSMKVAFDEPTGLELYDLSSEEHWINLSVENGNAMQQDGQFVADNNVEDEGPGSVEVYNLDLHKDGSISNAMPSKEDYSRNKSKIPKKVLAVDDQFTWKAKDSPAWKRVTKIPSKSNYHPDHFPVSSRSWKERVFGVGGVPELQVGCEGVEGFRRHKRSDTMKTDLSASESSVYIEPDYESEEELEEVVGEDELIKILRQAASTTDPTISHKNRGDMDPRVEPNRPRKKDKLPTRGDLGPSGDPDSSYNGQVPRGIATENQSTPRRKLLSVDGDWVGNDLGKQSADQGYGDNDSLMNDRKRPGYHDAQEHRRKNGRWRRGENRESDRGRNRVGGKKKAIDQTGWNYQKEQENDIRHNRLASVTRSQPSNLLLQQSARQSGRNENYGRQHGRRKGERIQTVQEPRLADVKDKNLRPYSSKITLIPSQKGRNNHGRKQDENEVRKPSLEVDAPQNLRFPLSTVPHNSRIGGYERLQNIRYGKGGYRQESQQEIDRLNALPVTAQIIISQERPGMDIPNIGNRQGETDITFPGLSPSNDGRQVPNFPSSPTSNKRSSPCAWAVMNCCSNRSRLATCFEANGCHGGHWDDPCSKNKIAAALQMVRQQYRG